MVFPCRDNGINWKACVPACTSTASFFFALSVALSCRFVAMTSDSSGANMHFGIMSWEDMEKREGTNEYKGVCKEYDTAPTSYLWIAAMYTAIVAVVLSAVIAVLFWSTVMFSLTCIGWKILLLMGLLCSFMEILTIIFYLFGNGCLGNDEGILKCSLSEGGTAAIGAVISLLLAYAAVWFYPPFFKHDHKDKLGESTNKLDCSRGIELNVMTKNADQTEGNSDKREVLSTVNVDGKRSVNSSCSSDSESSGYLKLSTGIIGYDKNFDPKEEEEKGDIVTRRKSSGLHSVELHPSELSDLNEVNEEDETTEKKNVCGSSV